MACVFNLDFRSGSARLAITASCCGNCPASLDTTYEKGMAFSSCLGDICSRFRPGITLDLFLSEWNLSWKPRFFLFVCILSRCDRSHRDLFALFSKSLPNVLHWSWMNNIAHRLLMVNILISKSSWIFWSMYTVHPHKGRIGSKSRLASPYSHLPWYNLTILFTAAEIEPIQDLPFNRCDPSFNRSNYGGILCSYVWGLTDVRTKSETVEFIEGDKTD